VIYGTGHETIYVLFMIRKPIEF